MSWLAEIWVLLRKEILMELRLKYAISGILLYVVSTILIVYMAGGQTVLDVGNSAPTTMVGGQGAMILRVFKLNVWYILFWIIILFASVNAIVKSFVQENSARQLYYYSLAHPTTILLSKIIYNVVLLFLLSLLTWGAFSFMVGQAVRQIDLFFLILFLGSAGFSITFTFVSAISAKANNNSTLLAILSFPLIIPILLTLLKLSANAIGIEQDTAIDGDIMILVGIDALLIGLSLVLFPFLWRD